MMHRAAQLELNRFVGVWNTTGALRDGGGALIATDRYEWLPGRSFLLHHVDARLGNQVARSLEVIGWSKEANTLVGRSYDDRGGTQEFRYALVGGEWAIDGDTLRFRGGFESDDRLAGAWEMLDNETWRAWLDIVLVRAD